MVPVPTWGPWRKCRAMLLSASIPDRWALPIVWISCWKWRNSCATPLSIHFIILGAGPQKARLVAEAARRELHAVHFLDAVPKIEVPAFLRSVHLGIAAFRPSPLTYIFLPNKFFDYLACGLPVMVNFDGEARAHLEGANAGIYVAPDDVPACAQAIKDLAASPERSRTMSANARRLAETRFSWDHKAVDFRDAISLGR